MSGIGLADSHATSCRHPGYRADIQQHANTDHAMAAQITPGQTERDQRGQRPDEDAQKLDFIAAQQAKRATGTATTATITASDRPAPSAARK